MKRNAQVAATMLYWMLFVVMILITIAMVGCGIITAWSIAGWLSPRIHEQMTAIFAHSGDGAAMVLNPLLMLLALAMLALAFRMLWHLRAVTGRVRRGDPFAPENGRDVYRVAWMLLALQIGSVILNVARPELGACPTPHHQFDATALLSVLVALVLAGVFREGTRLRDDVAGTI